MWHNFLYADTVVEVIPTPITPSSEAKTTKTSTATHAHVNGSLTSTKKDEPPTLATFLVMIT